LAVSVEAGKWGLSDVERMPESSLYPFATFDWNVVTEIAVHK
jgi:hypothetical protein